MKGNKIAKKIILLIFSIISTCIVINNFNHIKNIILLNKNVDNIILNYQDINKLNLLLKLENEDNLSNDEYRGEYFATYIDINVNEYYWNKIFNTIKKSRYSKMNIEIFFGWRYKMAQPLYNIIIEYKNGKETYIQLWENLLYINNVWYSATHESREIFIIIEEIINNNKINENIK